MTLSFGWVMSLKLLEGASLFNHCPEHVLLSHIIHFISQVQFFIKKGRFGCVKASLRRHPIVAICDDRSFPIIARCRTTVFWSTCISWAICQMDFARSDSTTLLKRSSWTTVYHLLWTSSLRLPSPAINVGNQNCIVLSRTSLILQAACIFMLFKAR